MKSPREQKRSAGDSSEMTHFSGGIYTAQKIIFTFKKQTLNHTRLHYVHFRFETLHSTEDFFDNRRATSPYVLPFLDFSCGYQNRYSSINRRLSSQVSTTDIKFHLQLLSLNKPWSLSSTNPWMLQCKIFIFFSPCPTNSYFQFHFSLFSLIKSCISWCKTLPFISNWVYTVA